MKTSPLQALQVRTGIDELLELWVPSLLLRDLLLDGRDLASQSVYVFHSTMLCQNVEVESLGMASGRGRTAVAVTRGFAYQVGGLDIENKLVLLEILQAR
jgi:hypothetical protein